MLVSFLNKITLANFNYGYCGCIYRMNLPSPEIQIPTFQGNNLKKKKVSRNIIADISVNSFGSVTAALEM